MKRINARVQHGRRQQHINLPPSGLGGIGHGNGPGGARQASAREGSQSEGRKPARIGAILDSDPKKRIRNYHPT
ncbi:hypothetical protein [Pseudomonas sp. NBRC 111123]|uniref:hypothetical protein n=1 Tax=Pseudomonas sp. NBRC 111123 TaxID=1661038 RepID=UPI0009E9A4EE